MTVNLFVVTSLLNVLGQIFKGLCWGANNIDQGLISRTLFRILNLSDDK